MFVKPKAGLSVPDPARNDLLPVEGREIDENIYWYRRIDCGDVIEVLPVTKKAAEPN